MNPIYLAIVAIPIVLLGFLMLGVMVYGLGQAVKLFHRDGVDRPPETKDLPKRKET